jgi:hypothetical protein
MKIKFIMLLVGIIIISSSCSKKNDPCASCKNWQDSVEVGMDILHNKGYKPFTVNFWTLAKVVYNKKSFNNDSVSFTKKEEKLAYMAMWAIDHAKGDHFLVHYKDNSYKPSSAKIDTFMVRMYLMDTSSYVIAKQIYEHVSKEHILIDFPGSSCPPLFHKTICQDISKICWNDLPNTYEAYYHEDYKYPGDLLFWRIAGSDIFVDSLVSWSLYNPGMFSLLVRVHAEDPIILENGQRIASRVDDSVVLKNTALFRCLPFDRFSKLIKNMKPYEATKVTFHGDQQTDFLINYVSNAINKGQLFSANELSDLYERDLITYKQFIDCTYKVPLLDLAKSDEWFSKINESDDHTILKMLVHRVVTEDEYIAVANFLQPHPEYMELLRKTHACCGS